ncbi:MAG: aminoacyl-tRNA deacylase [Candidatus Hodarchaeales archaeon]|jgi:prolyl-tRNA editing enzyme YbaK/EbsC (Cys-tRNA(Pro) deacylase)
MNSLQKFIKQNKIDTNLVKIHTFSSPTRTVEEAAINLNVKTNQIIKSIILLMGENYYLVIVPGNRKIRQKALRRVIKEKFADLSGDSRLATPDEVFEQTNFPVGAVPPIGVSIPIIIDENVLQESIVFGGGGTRNSILEIPVNILLEQTKGVIGNFTRKIE